MKLVGFLVFVVCDVILRLILNRSFFRELVSGWKVFFALAYCSIMGCVYREVMGGKGCLGFPKNPLTPSKLGLSLSSAVSWYFSIYGRSLRNWTIRGRPLMRWFGPNNPQSNAFLKNACMSAHELSSAALL